MRFRSLFCISTLLATSTGIYAVTPPPSFVGASSTFSVSQATAVPGETLKPGEYSIHVVDQLSDRMIVRVDSSTSTNHAIFLGVPRSGLSAGDVTGPVNWASGPNGTPALRGFAFSGDSKVEFVYPKAEAAAIAKLNAAKVVAVDPESEGRPTLKKMSHDDMQVVNLWMLSLTSAGPKDKTPAIAAQRYQGDSDIVSPVATAQVSSPATPAPQEPTQVASMQETPVAGSASSQTANQVQTTDQPQTASQPKRKPVIAKLPHTASYLPLVWLAGLFSLLGAGAMKLGRIS